MNEIQARTILAQRLARLFQHRADQVRILQLAGIDVTAFELDGRSDNVWIAILNELHNRRAIASLLQAVRRQDAYIDNPDLSQNELLWLACQLPDLDTQWQRVYTSACPPFWRGRRTATTVEAAIIHLWEMKQQSDETIPVLDFASQLAAQATSQHLAKALHDWVKSVGQGIWQIEDYQAHRKASADLVNRVQRVYLQLMLDPDPANENRLPHDYRFNLQALWWDDQPYPQKLFDSEGHLRLDQLFIQIKKLLNEDIDPLFNETMELAIECFLPAAVIAHLFTQEHKGVHAIDQWEVRGRRNPIKCGHDYPVVIRLQDRLVDYTPIEKKLWRKRWQSLQSHTLDQCEAMALWLGSEQLQNLLDELDKNEDLTFVGTLFAPSSSEELQAILYALLDTGTPVALLPRSCTNQESAVNLQQDVQANHLARLPHTIQALRKAAGSNQAHRGNHVTLLWDDPTRVPQLGIPYTTP